MTRDLSSLEAIICNAETVHLFLDYDGTLADFAPTPDTLIPETEIMGLLEDLISLPGLHTAVVSGRKLAHLRKLLPVKGLLIAGTYGIEILWPDGSVDTHADFDAVSPVLSALKPAWQALINSKAGFYLEDKGWSLALHAKDAAETDAREVLAKAEEAAQQHATDHFCILGGHRFLEIAPVTASKGSTVRKLLKDKLSENDTVLFLGDDDKDEEAFHVVHEVGGAAVKVGPMERETSAGYRLENPAAVRNWLHKLIHLWLKNRGAGSPMAARRRL